MLPSGLFFVKYFLKSSREIGAGANVGSLQVGTLPWAPFCVPINIHTKFKSDKTEEFSGNRLKVSDFTFSFSSFLNLFVLQMPGKQNVSFWVEENILFNIKCKWGWGGGEVILPSREKKWGKSLDSF